MTHLWWYVARASGLVAWGLAMASVLWGLALSTRALGPKPRAPWLLDLHRHLGGLTVAFVGLHLAGVVGDTVVTFGTADVLVPFASAWRPVAVAWGVVAFWLLLAVEVTSLLMRRLPKRWWHRIHLTSYVVAVMTTIHLFTAGTDAGAPVLRLVAVAFAALSAFFLVYRRIGPGARPGGQRPGADRPPALAQPGRVGAS
jgi:DMSO/TMAO reductase YedYZ heme-binding membrane subunit